MADAHVLSLQKHDERFFPVKSEATDFSPCDSVFLSLTGGVRANSECAFGGQLY